MTDLVVGAGISGATMARLLAESGRKVHVIDRRAHIAGNCYDFPQNGIMVHKYGPHVFHTSDKKVWDFVSRFTDFNTYMHRTMAVIDGIETSLPFNFRTLHDVFPPALANRLEQKLLDRFEYNTSVPILSFMDQDDEDLRFLAKYIYEKVFLHYTQKQWDSDPEKLDRSVTARVPIRMSMDDRYFLDTYQGIPVLGYTSMIRNMLDHPLISVQLNTDFRSVAADEYETIYHTGPIDEYAGYEFGELPYRSLRFKFEIYNQDHVLPCSVVNYPCNYDFTRISEFKYLLNDSSDKTIIAKEYPEPYIPGVNERYYPIPKESTAELYLKYARKVENESRNVRFFGRLGDYRYYNMDAAIRRAMDLFESIHGEKRKKGF